MAEDKVREFRDNNIALTKEVSDLREANATLTTEVERLRAVAKTFEGIDPAAAAASAARIAALEDAAQVTAPKLAALEADLAAERTAHSATRSDLGRAALRAKVGALATAAGANPKALEMLLDRAEPVFTLDGGNVVARPDHYSPNRPGERLTVEEWLTQAQVDFHFLFLPSSGANASPSRGRSGATTTSTGRVLVNPTPEDLGRYGDAIRRGEIRIKHTND